MFSNKYMAYFIVLLFPMLIAGLLIYTVYSLQVHGHIEINWLFVVLIAIVLDALFTWLQVEHHKKTEDTEK